MVSEKKDQDKVIEELDALKQWIVIIQVFNSEKKNDNIFIAKKLMVYNTILIIKIMFQCRAFSI